MGSDSKRFSFSTEDLAARLKRFGLSTNRDKTSSSHASSSKPLPSTPPKGAHEQQRPAHIAHRPNPYGDYGPSGSSDDSLPPLPTPPSLHTASSAQMLMPTPVRYDISGQPELGNHSHSAPPDVATYPHVNQYPPAQPYPSIPPAQYYYPTPPLVFPTPYLQAPGSPQSTNQTVSTPPPPPSQYPPSSYPSSIPVLPQSATQPHILTTPLPPLRRPRASSVPPSPVSPTSPKRSQAISDDNDDDGVRCAGVTKAGKRCTRIVKSPHPLNIATPAGSDEVERFCFQHMKEVLIPSGFYARGGEKWVDFDDWIPDYLAPDTRAALRIEMEKPASASDVDGYIYAYEIRDPKTPNQVHIKVGRAVNMVKRLDEWSKQCESKEVVLRGWWPGTVYDNDDDSDTAGPSLLRGRIKAGPKGKYCHRLERLIHLELSDLMVHEPYLGAKFEHPSKTVKAAASSPSPTASPAKTPKPSATTRPQRRRCPDCGTMHKEIFTFTRVTKGKLKGKEWAAVVQPVIERWGRFVEEVM